MKAFQEHLKIFDSIFIRNFLIFEVVFVQKRFIFSNAFWYSKSFSIDAWKFYIYTFDFKLNIYKTEKGFFKSFVRLATI